MDSFAQRRQRLVQTLAEEQLDALLLSQPVNVSYLTGFSGDSSYLILTRDKTILVSDGRFTTQLAEECPGLETYIRPPVQSLTEAAGTVLNKLAVQAVGFESGHLTVADHDALREAAKTAAWKPAKDRVEKLRQIKDAGEIAQLRQAIRLAERAFAMFRSFLRPEDTEKELTDALEMYIRRAGGKCGSFPCIVAVGERAALPHAPPTARRLDEADLVLVDWGASGAFYNSDLTRVLLTNNTFGVRGAPSPDADKIQHVYDVVLRAQRRALEFLRPGVKAKDVDAAAREVIAQAGYGEQFTHSLGHGLGMQVHEAPFLKPGCEVAVEAGMVVTIEPGIYLPGWAGIRIEDDVLVTPDGCEVLTHLPRDLTSNVVEL